MRCVEITEAWMQKDHFGGTTGNEYFSYARDDERVTDNQ